RTRPPRSDREVPGSPRSIRLNCRLPASSSRTISGVQRSAKISDARATGQYCWYLVILHSFAKRPGLASPKKGLDLVRFLDFRRHSCPRSLARGGFDMNRILITTVFVATATVAFW